MKILIIEDEATLCLLYKLELEEEGYDVVFCRTAEEGERLFKAENPDLVTLDINLSAVAPREGLDLLVRMKETRPDVPVILLTGYEACKSDVREKLADAYIMKDSKLEELKSTIKKICTRSNLVG